MLQNSYPYMVFPTFSSPLTHTHIFLSTSSSPPQTGAGIFPHSFPTPCFHRWNSILFLDMLLCFTFPILIHFTPPPALRSTSFHFTSHMLSSLEFRSCSTHCSTAPFHSSNIIPLLFLDFSLDSSLLSHYLSYRVTQSSSYIH